MLRFYRSVITASAYVFLSLTLLLTGCSGGGGGGSTTPPPSGVTLSGSVVKGQLRYGLVKVYEVVNGVASVTPLITGETDANGQYTLTVPSGHTGPFKVVVSRGPNSEMLCDATPSCGGIPFGQPIPADQLPNLRLSALVPSKSAGANVPVNVSPLTHMAASYAQSVGLSSEMIQAANDKVGALFDVTDITGTTPVDITDVNAVKSAADANQVKLALFAAALAQMASEQNISVDQLLDRLAAAYASHEGQLSTQVAAGEVSLDELVKGAQAVRDQLLSQDPNSISTAVTTTLNNLESTAATPGVTNTQVTLPPPPSGLAVAKALMSKLRTYWQGVLAPDSVLQTANTAFSNQVGLAQRAGTLVNSDMGLYQALVAAAAQYASNSPGPSLLGACGSNHELEAIEAIIALDPGISGCLTITGSPSALFTGQSFAIELEATLSSGAALRFAATLSLVNANQTLRMQLTDGSLQQTDVYTLTFSNGLFNLNFVEAITLLNIDNLQPASITSSIDAVLQEAAVHAPDNNPVHFSGSLSLDSLFERVTGWYDVQWNYDPNTGQTTTVSTPYPDDMAKPRTLSLSGSVANETGDSYQISSTAKMTNAASFKLSDILPVDYPRTAGGNYQFSADSNSVALTWMEQKRTVVSFDPQTGMGSVSYYRMTSTGWLLEGGYDAGGPFSSLREMLLSNAWFFSHLTYWIDNQGYYKVIPAPGGAIVFDEQNLSLTLPDSLAGVSGALDGVLWEPDWYFGMGHDYYYNTSDNYMLAELTLSFTLDLNGLPPLSVTLSGKTTGYEAGTGSAVIAYDSRRLEMTASGDQSSGVMTLSATDEAGASLTIAHSDTQTSGALSKDGIVYGVVSMDPSTGAQIIRYVDGSFESLF